MNKLTKAIIYPFMGMALLSTMSNPVYAKQKDKEPAIFYYESANDDNGNGKLDYPEEYRGIVKFGPIIKPAHLEAGKEYYLKFDNKNAKLHIKEKNGKVQKLENLLKGEKTSLFKIKEPKGKYNLTLDKGYGKIPVMGKIIFK